MSKKEKIEMMVEGGKAAPGPEMGQKLGPLKIPIPNILKDINAKTEAFKGVKVPVKLIIDTETKEYTIEVGTPPVSELIKKELKLEKGSSTANKMKVGNVGVETLIKIGKMKMDSMYTNKIKSAVKTVAGSCNSMGILVEGKLSTDFNKDLEEGKYDKELKEQKTEISSEKVTLLKEQLEGVQEELRKQAEKLAAEEAVKAAAAAATAPVKAEGEEGAAPAAAEGEKAEKKPDEKATAAKPEAKKEEKPKK